MDRSLPPLRPRTYVEPDNLRSYAVSLFEASGDKQSDLAASLGVSDPTVSRALVKESTRYLKTVLRIIEHYTGYRLRPVYRVEKRE